MISNRERFYGLPNPKGGNYAPMTIGAPQLTNPIEYKEFKNSKDEKVEKKFVKGMHKKELMKWYPDGVGKKLNIPSKSLSESVINTF